MGYYLRAAIKSLYHERWINLLSVLSMATALLMITTALIVLYNIELFSRKLPERFSMVAYLKDDVSESERDGIISTLKKDSIVQTIKYISKDEALRELKSSLKGADYILEGLKDNPLPASVEIKLKRDAVTPDSVSRFISSLKKVKGIEDIQYGEKFLFSLNSIKRGIETLGLIIASIMTIGTVFISYSTVKILFYRRREEIETLKLLGATARFIRMPFLIEGGIIGLVGGLISAFLISAFYYIIFLRLGFAIPLVQAVVFYPAMAFPVPLVGFSLGIIGAMIAIGRLQY